MTDILHRNKSFTNALHIDFAPMVKGIRVVISLMIRGLAATGDAAMRSSSAISRAFAMAYVDRELRSEGTTLAVEMRGKRLDARVTPLPFVSHRYHR